MSRGQIPRTPEYFRRMNDRAGRRRARRAAAHPPTIGEIMRQFSAAVRRAAAAIVEGFRPLAVQFDDLARRLALPRFAEGGEVKGPRPDNDSIPVMLSPGLHSLDGGQTWHEEPDR